MPGRRTPPMPERLAPQWAISAFTSVPVALPAAGWTTIPRGLSMTMISSSSNTILSGMSLRRGRRRLRRRQCDGDGVAGVDAMARIADCAPADRHFAGKDQGLQPRARQVGDRYGERAVEPIAGIRVGDHDCFDAMINGHKHFAT